jgi:hypothetical protein
MSDPSKPRRSKADEGACVAPAPPELPAPDPIDAATLDEAFVKALEADFIAYGKGAIEKMRADKPTDYVKLVAALRATEADDANDPLREISDAELDRSIRELAPDAGYEIKVAAVPARGEAAADAGADAD